MLKNGVEQGMVAGAEGVSLNHTETIGMIRFILEILRAQSSLSFMGYHPGVTKSNPGVDRNLNGLVGGDVST